MSLYLSVSRFNRRCCRFSDAGSNYPDHLADRKATLIGTPQDLRFYTRSFVLAKYRQSSVRFFDVNEGARFAAGLYLEFTVCHGENMKALDVADLLLRDPAFRNILLSLLRRLSKKEAVTIDFVNQLRAQYPMKYVYSHRLFDLRIRSYH